MHRVDSRDGARRPQQPEGRLQLTGDAAFAWFLSRRWTPSAPAGERVGVVVDELVTPLMTVRRIWHTPVRLRRSEAASGPGPVAFDECFLQIEGDLDITAASGEARRLLPFSATLAAGGVIQEMSSAMPTARIELISRRRSPSRDPRTRMLAVHRGPTTAWSVLASATNAVLNSPPRASAGATPLIVRTLEHALAALVLETDDGERVDDASRPNADLHGRALAVIQRAAADPDFSVERLADALGVARRTLERAFSAHGTTARAALRSERVSIAQVLSVRRPRPTDAEVARAAGFPSPRALREALRFSEELARASR